MSWFRKYTKTHFMKRKILLIISIGLILLSACSKEKEQTVGEEISYLEDEKTENAFYQMFYGEWEITERVYLDKIPVSGVEYTEKAGKYYVLVEVNGGEKENITFFVKDEDTIIVYKNSYCIEYRRISFEGGSQEPAIILG